MREIKFRSWSRTYGKMIYVDSLLLAFDMLHGHWSDGPIGDVHQPHPMQKGVLMQYTGLKDKNSVEIYEGDIISTGEEDRRFVIIPMLGGLSVHHVCFMGEAYNELVSMPTNDAQTAQWLSENTVIGNIHENLIDEARDNS